MKKSVLSFFEFVNESYVKVYEESKDNKGESKKDGSGEYNWDFNFESGKFLKSDIGEDSLKKIKEDFKKNILPTLNDPQYTGQVISINLIASTSKVSLGPNAKKALENAGYKDPTNKVLAEARLDTLESIVNDLLFEYLASKEDDKKEFIKNVKNKIKIKKTPKPNIGPDYEKGKDDKDDEKYKAVQKISSEIEIIGERIEEDRLVSCGKSTRGTGQKGTIENNFVGYEKNLFIRTKSGDEMKIKFDPFTVPDCFIYKYMDEIKLSVFSGNFGGLLAQPFVDAEFQNYLKSAKEGKVINPEKRNIGGKDYIVFDYKKTINEIYNKDNALVNAINKKIKSMGIKGDIKSLQPKFFDSKGKIEIYSNKAVKDMPSNENVKMNAYNKEYIIKKILPTPPICDPVELELIVKKKFVRDSLDLVVFSPCAGTSFSLDSVCKSPKG